MKAPVFESASVPPPEGSKVFHTDQWESVRDLCLPPVNPVTLGDDLDARGEFILGAGLMRLDGPRAKVDKRFKRRMTPRPAQLVISDALSGADRFVGLLAPRRSTKTSALLAVALGRIMTREDYRVSYTMTTLARKARDRFKLDVKASLEFLYPDPKTRPFKLNNAGGSESVTCEETGSILQFGAPRGDTYRSDAWDLMIVDEGGEAEVEQSEDLLAGALATMDTIPDAQFVVAGTAGPFRKGNLLWDMLEDGRAGKNRTTALEWACSQDLTVADIDTWEDFEPLLLASHPGIGHGSTAEDIRANFEKWPRSKALAEYLGVFGQVGGTSFIDMVKWSAAADTGTLPGPPERFTMAFQVHPDSTVASIVAAWRGDDATANLLVLWHGPVRGLFAKVEHFSKTYRVPVAYDSGSAATDSEAQKMNRARPRPRLMPQKWADVSTAAALLVKEIESEGVRHWDQDALTTAARDATKRGTKESKRWAFGRPDDETDITSLEAASIALRAFDEAPPRAALRPVVA